MTHYKSLLREIKYVFDINIITAIWNYRETYMYQGNYLVILTHTAKGEMTLRKVLEDIKLYLTEWSSHVICRLRKLSHIWLQKLNIQHEQSYVVKYFFSVQFTVYCSLLIPHYYN